MNNDYEFFHMEPTVKRIRDSLKNDSDSWELRLETTTANSITFGGKTLGVLVHASLPDYKFIVYADVQYFKIADSMFFDLLQGDDFFGMYSQPVFSSGQKTSLRNSYRDVHGNMYNALTQLMKDNELEIQPFRNVEQRDIAKAFSG